MMKALETYNVSDIRFCGGKIGEALHGANVMTMGDVRRTEVDKL